MKKQEALEWVRASLTMKEADWNAFRAFRSSLDWLPAELVTPFVEKHVSRTDGATLASMLRRVTPTGEAAVLAGLRAHRTQASVFLESLVTAGHTLADACVLLARLTPTEPEEPPAIKQFRALAKRADVIEARARLCRSSRCRATASSRSVPSTGPRPRPTR